MTSSHIDPLQQAQAWASQGAKIAIATVIKTWGSAPRPTGSQLVIRDDGAFSGSVSGGCIENAVIAEAKDVIVSGMPKKLSFGVTNETAWSVGLACGGQIEIFVERLD
jgi:xanthine/CO dehydrogenase XdhC/CoxF family maturation factor